MILPKTITNIDHNACCHASAVDCEKLFAGWLVIKQRLLSLFLLSVTLVAYSEHLISVVLLLVYRTLGQTSHTVIKQSNDNIKLAANSTSSILI